MACLSFRRWPALLVVPVLGTGLLVAPAQASSARDGERAVVRALNRGARPLRSTSPYGPLRDLRPLGRMIGRAPVVGLGEATHGSHQFFTLKHRVFRYLVKKKGFTTFMQELNWGSGLRLNDYVLYGKGNPRKIMLEEFRQAYTLFGTEEYLHLIKWIRAYNRTHHRKLQYMGDDVYYPHVRIFQEIFKYVRKRGRADLIPRLRALYDGLIPTTDLGTWEKRYHQKSLAERKRQVVRAQRALALVRSLRRGASHRAADWAEQNAKVVVWTARTHATDAFWDPRDKGMAENTVWWLRHKHSKILLSAHNAHVGYTGFDPEMETTRQGEWLRRMLGRRYVPIGTTFYQGSFNAFDVSDPAEPLRRFTIGPPPATNSEHVLDKVRFRDYMLDMRAVGQPARAWLDQRRPIRNIGSAYPEKNDVFALRRTYMLLIHIHRITASHLLAPDGGQGPTAGRRLIDTMPPRQR